MPPPPHPPVSTHPAIKECGAAVGKSPLMAPMGTSLPDDHLKALVDYLKKFKGKWGGQAHAAGGPAAVARSRYSQ